MDIDEKETASPNVTRSVPQHVAKTEKHGYMHREMIRIPCREMFEDSNVDSAGAVIILFNIAILQHISSISSNNEKRMAKTLRLYQLCN